MSRLIVYNYGKFDIFRGMKVHWRGIRWVRWIGDEYGHFTCERWIRWLETINYTYSWIPVTKQENGTNLFLSISWTKPQCNFFVVAISEYLQKESMSMQCIFTIWYGYQHSKKKNIYIFCRPPGARPPGRQAQVPGRSWLLRNRQHV